MRRFLLLLAAGLLAAGLSCNYPAFVTPAPSPSPVPPSPSPVAPTSIPTHPPESPEAEGMWGQICVLAYEDSNRNAMRDDDERPLPGVLFSLQRDGVEVQTYLSTTMPEPFCFVDLPAGNYQVQAQPPDEFEGTNPTTLSISLGRDKRIPVVLGFATIPQLLDGKMILEAGGTVAAIVGESSAGDALYLLTDTTLQRTDDGGRTWTVVGARPPADNMIMSPADLNLLFAGDGLDCFRGGPAAPLSISRDGGKSWAESPGGQNLRPAAAHPTNPAVAWAVGCDGAYRTGDGGANWQRQLAEAWGLYTLETIRPVAGHPEVLYAAGNSEGGSGAVFRSDDGGESWRTVADSLELWTSALLPHPTNPDEVWFATPSGVWHSRNGGSHWEESAAGLEAAAGGDDYQVEGKGLHALARARSGVLYLGTEQGVFQSGDGGAHWRPLAGTPWEHEPVSHLFINDAGRLWVTAASGVYIYTP